jgi:protoporphyrinogen/coproporphyrinogen III oxidase
VNMGGWSVRVDNGEEITCQSLILAVPAYAAACLLQQSVSQVASLLNEIEYAPVCVVAAAYDRASVVHPLDGFGFMIPRREGMETICTFWNSWLFEGRAPTGKVVLTSFAGRNPQSGLFTGTEQHCAELVHAENAKVLGITGAPIDRVVWRNARALPQYNIGHARRVQQITDNLRDLANLYLAGNYLKGRSIGDCVQTAFDAAQNIHSRSREPNIQ